MRWSDVTAEDRAQVKAQAERRLTLDEWNAYVGQAGTPDERQGIDDLLDWFTRRYPTPEARLRYARHAYRRWMAR